MDIGFAIADLFRHSRGNGSDGKNTGYPLGSRSPIEPFEDKLRGHDGQADAWTGKRLGMK
ncbi:MAG: hypothetical protein NT178_18350 [Proteobacteria bacterium]|nr:hypothetical protein [Pseudomonadota bacterium]